MADLFVSSFVRIVQLCMCDTTSMSLIRFESRVFVSFILKIEVILVKLIFDKRRSIFYYYYLTIDQKHRVQIYFILRDFFP